MTIDTVFKPLTPTSLVGVSAVQVAPDAQNGGTTFRVRCLVSAYLSWGFKSTITALGAPAAGVAVANTVGMTAGTVETFEIPTAAWFISNVAAAFEITNGQGS